MKNLYESINTLILENASDVKIPNVDKVHTAFEVVLGHVKKEKQNNISESTNTTVESFDINQIVNYNFSKLLKKHSSLNEEEKNILTVLFKDNKEEKDKLFTSLKESTLNKLNALPLSEKVNTVKQKLESMNNDEAFYQENIFKIYELKSSLN
jgi:hypothetical protein